MLDRIDLFFINQFYEKIIAKNVKEFYRGYEDRTILVRKKFPAQRVSWVQDL